MRIFGSSAYASLSSNRFNVIDIGARGGIPFHWERAAPLLSVLAFEPDPQEAERLSAKLSSGGARVVVCQQAVWEDCGIRTLYVTRNPGNSSLFEPRREFLSQFPDASRFDVVATSQVATTTIDEAQRPESFGASFIKIDVQGGALPVLKGARRALEHTLGLEIEVELAPLYEGEPLLGDVDAFLRPLGFELVDLRPTYWRRAGADNVAGTLGQLVFADVLYMLAPETLRRRLQSGPSEEAARTALCARLCCDVYRLNDWMTAYAHALHDLNLPGRASYAPFPAGRRIARWPDFPGRHPMGLMLKDLADLLLQSSHSWANAEQRIGGKPRSRHLARWI